jgi:biopolymer transport protein ExbD
MKLPKPALRKGRIEIIPMIDTIFFLLVFFMFSALSMINMKGMGVSLPRPVTTPPAQSLKLIVRIDADGKCTLNDSPVLMKDLTGEMQKKVKSSQTAVVVLDAAPNQTTQQLINMMDAVNKVKLASGETPPILIATDVTTPIDGSAKP